MDKCLDAAVKWTVNPEVRLVECEVCGVKKSIATGIKNHSIANDLKTEVIDFIWCFDCSKRMKQLGLEQREQYEHDIAMGGVA